MPTTLTQRLVFFAIDAAESAAGGFRRPRGSDSAGLDGSPTLGWCGRGGVRAAADGDALEDGLNLGEPLIDF
jgi:hypothetical protein